MMQIKPTQFFSLEKKGVVFECSCFTLPCLADQIHMYVHRKKEMVVSTLSRVISVASTQV